MCTQENAVKFKIRTFRRMILNQNMKISRPNCVLNKTIYIQLNKYETAPNFIQLNQNLTSDCLVVDLAGRTGKNREIQLNQQTI